MASDLQGPAGGPGRAHATRRPSRRPLDSRRTPPPGHAGRHRRRRRGRSALGRDRRLGVPHGEQRVEPADTHGAPHLPDRFYQPSPWLHAFDGPPGHLVAVGTAEHRSLFHSRTDVYGVTAVGGAYGFLDLPESAVAGDTGGPTSPALSPDGSRLAFWTTGTPSGTPNTHLLGVTITGVSVYDTTTGRVEHAALDTVHGISPALLTWSDDRTLVLGIEQAT